MPEVTVLMPVYNGAEFLEPAIKSILSQTFTDFEFLIINDGSDDGTKEIIQNFYDKRIRYIENGSNLGLIKTLNMGLELAKGIFIARMDADDVSTQSRIEKQVLFMKNNPEIDILGTWFSILGSDTTISHPLSNEECKIKLLQSTVLGHPTVLLKKESILKNGLRFHEASKYAEDYRFWAEATLKGLKISNLPEVLLNYRIHDNQISTSFKDDQAHIVNQIRLWYGTNYFGEIIEKNTDLYLKFLNGDIVTMPLYKKVKTLVTTLEKLNKISYPANQIYLSNLYTQLLNNSAEQCFKLCIDCNMFNLVRAFSDKRFYYLTTLREKIKFIIKSLS